MSAIRRDPSKPARHIVAKQENPAAISSLRPKIQKIQKHFAMKIP
jgi:hypothetical protein